MASSMSTIPMDLPVAAAAVSAAPPTLQPAVQATEQPPVRARLRRAPAVLAPTLPALLLLGLCIAGMSDPPGPPTGHSGVSSQLHVPTEEPSYLPSVPLKR
jgi:hypothetical protein